MRHKLPDSNCELLDMQLNMATVQLERSLLWMKVVFAGGECKGKN